MQKYLLFTFIGVLSIVFGFKAHAQEPIQKDFTRIVYPDDSTPNDDVNAEFADSILDALSANDKQIDNLASQKKHRDWSKWRPDTKRAMWLAIVLPGAGQIYNRKYWKLPIIYGGFVGCFYALTWNNQMYHDYSQAYMDIMDNDPNTQSYNSFLHLGNVVTESNKAKYQELFRKRKDRYRKWRDLSVFSLIGVYALSIIDAYVDASLSEFDISDDLSLHIAPTVMSDKQSRNPLQSTAVGIGCSLTF